MLTVNTMPLGGVLLCNLSHKYKQQPHQMKAASGKTYGNGLVNTEGIVDFADECSGEIFEPLQDMIFFKNFILDKELGTIRWPNGADFAPEFLKDLLLNADQQVQSESV